MDTESKRIIRILIVLSVMFVALIIYLSYFEIFEAAKIEKNSYNKRQWINEENVLRGKIVDRRGKTLAYSEKKGNEQVRYYKYGTLYSHIIGYSLKEYGKAGLEASYNKELLGLSNHNLIWDIAQKITGSRQEGNNIILTIDHDLQSYAEQRLKGKKGAIVLMNPQNGEIYAMVSKPDFHPSKIRETWNEIIEDEDSPLLNRATMGLYTPGSIFKIITATAALQNEGIDTTYQCEGFINIDGYILKDYKERAHGQLDLKEALVQSCNVAFSQIGLQLGEEKLKDTARKFMFNEVIPFDLMTKSSVFPRSMMTRPELGATAIGQGKVLVTPLNMALMVSAVANDGIMMKPLIIKEMISPEGKTLIRNTPEVLGRVSTSLVSQRIRDMMISVVNEGTGKKARIQNIKVAGKTGTAENETGKEHAWFVAFAPAEEPKVAIAVVLENAGMTGGEAAAPIARDIMATALKILK